MNSGLIISLFTVGITVSLQLIFIRYASYEIDKDIYGNFVLLQTLIAGLSSILLQVPGQALDRFYNESIDKIKLINQFRTQLIFINILSFFSIYIYSIFVDRFSTLVLSLLFFLFMLINIYSLNQKIYLLNLERKKYMILKILEASSKFLTPIIFYEFNQTIESLIYGMISGYFISSILLIYFMKNKPFSLTIDLEDNKKYFRYAYPFIFMTIFTWSLTFSDRYFIDYFLDSKEVANYAILAMVAGMGQVIGQIYFMYTQPKILKIHSENPRSAFTDLKKYLYNLSIVFVILFLIIILLPKIIFTILVTKELIFDQYYFNTMLVLIVSIFLNVLHIAHHLYMKLLKKIKILGYIYFIAFIINIIGNLFIEDYGIIAAAISTLISYIVILLLQILYVHYYFTRTNKIIS